MCVRMCACMRVSDILPQRHSMNVLEWAYETFPRFRTLRNVRAEPLTDYSTLQGMSGACWRFRALASFLALISIAVTRISSSLPSLHSLLPAPPPRVARGLSGSGSRLQFRGREAPGVSTCVCGNEAKGTTEWPTERVPCAMATLHLQLRGGGEEGLEKDEATNSRNESRGRGSWKDLVNSETRVPFEIMGSPLLEDEEIERLRRLRLQVCRYVLISVLCIWICIYLYIYICICICVPVCVSIRHLKCFVPYS